MRFVLLPLAALSLAYAPAPLPRPDLKRIQGQWALVRETHANGPPRPKRTLLASVARDRVTFFPEGDDLAGEWAVTLAAGAEPKAIDLKKDGGRLIRAVYSLRGDTLVGSWGKDTVARSTRQLSPAGGARRGRTGPRIRSDTA